MRTPGQPERSRRRGLLVWALVALTLAGALESVTAQSPEAPPATEPFHKSYYVYGRVVDVNGDPVYRANVTLSLDHPDVRSYSFRAPTDCHGDYGGVFKVPFIDWQYEARARIDSKVVTEPANAYTRRSDIVLQLDRARTNFETPGQSTGCYEVSEYWDSRYTVAGRVVRYNESAVTPDGEDAFSEPVVGRSVFAEYWRPIRNSTEHQRFPPPAQKPILTDAQGDFKYSWVMTNNLTNGFITMHVGGQDHNITTLDLESRYTAVLFVLGDAPPPPSKGIPAPAIGLVVAGVAAAAFIAGRRGLRPS